jgi:aryl-alcohol dehydrogenase-like predicted oxidoreductase
VSNHKIDRREFLGTCVVAAGVGSLSCAGEATPPHNPYDAKGLPTRMLGNTGLAIPVIVFGGGSRFCSVTDQDESLAILNRALDSGFYHWDTAHDYTYEGVISEERYGLILKDRREEVFLSTKTIERTRDGALRHVEESLQRLQTDHVDLLQLHSIATMEDVDAIGTAGGAIEALYELKEQGVTRFIGFTGHSSGEALAAAARRFDFDTMLFALNHYAEGQQDRQETAIPAAVSKNMGILVMKVIRPKETDESLNPAELVRYALSLEHVTAAVIGTDSLDVVTQNAELARNFTPMDAQEMEQVAAKLRPVFDSGRLAWMQPGYTDGIPA